MTRNTVQSLVEHYGMTMQEDGEGTFFARTYESALKDASGTPLLSTMYGLYSAQPRSFSRFHRLTCDESWSFYEGDPLELHLIAPDGTYRRVVLGPCREAGQEYQHTIPAGTWQAGQLVEGGTYALYSCTVVPSFHEGCYEAGTEAALCALCPAQTALIRAFV